MDTHAILNKPIREIVGENPVFEDFFSSFRIDTENEQRTFMQCIDTFTDSYWEAQGLSRHELTGMFVDFISGLDSSEQASVIHSLELLPGKDKDGQPEKCGLQLIPGEITCIVGPTGSGKSRLLADIEWLANEDTPTKRKVLINGEAATDDLVRHFGGRLIAQITQNMNFVLDMEVESFLMLHAQSRFLPDARQTVSDVIGLANQLSGETFSPHTPVTFLSGGQSRALMIADVACIGQSPIVLIDEIENAGVNKKKALDLLVSQDKIVLMATHDPLLILLADKRVVIKNGGMRKVIRTNKEEKSFYNNLKEIDDTLQKAKDYFRNGNELFDTNDLLSD